MVTKRRRTIAPRDIQQDIDSKIACSSIVAGNTQFLKYVSLVTLTLQNAVLGLSMRYARTRSGDMFLSSTGREKKKK